MMIDNIGYYTIDNCETDKRLICETAKYLMYKLNYNNWLVIDYNIKDKGLNMVIFNKEKIKKVTSYLEYELVGPVYVVHIKNYKEI